MAEPMSQHATGEKLAWIAISLNAVVFLLCAALIVLFVQTRPDRSQPKQHTADSNPSSRPGENDLTIEYLRALKSRADTSAQILDSFGQAIDRLQSQLKSLSTQAKTNSDNLAQLEEQIAELQSKTEDLSRRFTELLSKVSRSDLQQKQIVNMLAALRIRDLSRDIRDIKRALSKTARSETQQATSSELMDAINQLSGQLAALMQEISETKDFVSKLEKMQAQKRKEEQALHEFLKKYTPAMKDLPVK